MYVPLIKRFIPRDDTGFSGLLSTAPAYPASSRKQ